MRPSARRLTLTAVLIVAVVALYGCAKPANPSVYSPNAPSSPDPTITAISPAGSAVAGIDTVTITGTGYTTNPGAVTVYFNNMPGTVYASSTTQVNVMTPLLVADSVGVRVAVQGAYGFSNTMQYKLRAAVAQFGGLDTTLPANERATALAMTSAGHLFAGFTSATRDSGVLEFDATGARSRFCLTTGASAWTGFKIGPAGALYAVRNARAIFQIPQGGTLASTWTSVSGAAFTDFDFDENSNLWAGGSGTKIYLVHPDKTVKSFAFTGQIHSFRVFDGYLYFAAKTTDGEKIWRGQILTDSLTTPVVYFDFGAAYPTFIPNAITFTAAGDLVIGSNAPDGLIFVSPAKTVNAPYAKYTKSFGTGLAFLAWGSADDLYASTSDGLLLKFNITGKTSAPYYGRP